MDTPTVTLFLALLAVAAQAIVVGAVLLFVVGRLSPAARSLGSRVAAEVGPQALGLAAGVAAVCTAGSLYLSEVAHFLPCRLCWYQRAAMYPLVLVLGASAVARFHRIRPFAAAVALVGGAVSCFHILVERYPNLETSSCDPNNPCSIIWVEKFGYLTIPTMALSGFALILVLLAVARPSEPTTTAQEAP
ncbi:disulfide bond formation protein B [Aquihabitans sp. G128]|uniref:disulfide bond formation protein B n=1 Tax=Aquihabitans sp. G128 TaxID=2849779 RepID=UPI001C24FA19|nr:disulfide bond formation protein B [Aquihabitans sp. G128]QXC63322.1 disulfide bond formation protein B [Aquihabitans sp. G128]